MRYTRILPALLAALVAVAAAACIDLEVKTEIKDLRILAVRLDPPEVLYSSFLSLPADQRPPDMFRPPPPFPAAEQEVVATVLAADPRGDAPVAFTSFVCPASDNELCRNYQIPDEIEETERAPDELRTALDPLVTRRGAWAVPVDEQGTLRGELGRFPFNERAVEYILPHGPGGAAVILLENLARVVLYAEQDGIREVAFRRLPLNAYLDLSFLPPETQGQFEEFLGVSVCNAEQSAARDPSCLWLREANKNPVIEEVRYSLDGSSPEYDEDDIDTREFGEPVTGPIALEPGEEIRLWPVLADDVSEAYQSFGFDLETSSIFLAQFTEDMAVSWYASSPGMGQDLTDLTLNLGFDTTFTYPSSQPPENVVVYIVVRDQRGGVAWQTVVLTRG